MRAKFHTAMAIIAERSEIRVGDRVFIKVSSLSFIGFHIYVPCRTTNVFAY